MINWHYHHIIPKHHKGTDDKDNLYRNLKDKEEPKMERNVTYRFYRGTTIREANELALDTQTRDVTHWTDSFDNAAKYSKGAVVEIEMDELPPHFNAYRGVCEGDAIHGTFAEWVLPRDYFENRASCFVEVATVHPV